MFAAASPKSRNRAWQLALFAALTLGCVAVSPGGSPDLKTPRSAPSAAPGSASFAPDTPLPNGSATPIPSPSGATPIPTEPRTNSERPRPTASPTPTGSPRITPPGDDQSDAIVIGNLPYSDALTNRGATVSVSDPECADSQRTIWLSYTPARSGMLGATVLGGNDYDAALLVAERSTTGAVVPIACNGGAFDSEFAAIRFAATAGTTYLFMLGRQDNRQGSYEFELGFSPIPSLGIDVTSGMVDGSTIIVRGSATCSPRLEDLWVTVVVRQVVVGAADARGTSWFQLKSCTSSGENWSTPVKATTGTFAYLNTDVTARLSYDDVFDEYDALDEAEIPFEDDPTPSPAP